MSPVRQSAPGATRTCPHCRATILESEGICPVCRHHLRFEPKADGGKAGSPAQRSRPGFPALRVEGSVRHPPVGEPWEYSVMLSIRNDQGEEIARHVVGVGALYPAEERTFTLAVEVFKPGPAPRDPVLRDH